GGAARLRQSPPDPEDLRRPPLRPRAGDPDSLDRRRGVHGRVRQARRERPVRARRAARVIRDGEGRLAQKGQAGIPLADAVTNDKRPKTIDQRLPEDAMMKELARTLIPRFALAILLSLCFAIACSVALGEEGAEPAGSDVFTSPREALLREKPSPQGRIASRLPQGTHLTLREARPTHLRVDGGWISRDVVVVFGPHAPATP